MPITSRAGQIVALDKILDETELNVDTRGVCTEIFAICQRFDRSTEREKKFKSKKLGGGVNQEAIKTMPPPFDVNSYVPEEKKSRIAPPVNQVEPEPDPIEVDQKDETNEIKIFDLFQSGIESAKTTYPKAGQFKKALKELGIQAEGKTHEELWSALQAAFDNLTPEK